jgi:hypothetical protein
MKTSLAVGAIVTSLAAVPGGSAAADDARLAGGRKWVRITAPAFAKQPVIGDLVASEAERAPAGYDRVLRRGRAALAP